jgi:hypothetical protein
MSARPPLQPGVYQEVLGGKVNYEAVIIVDPADRDRPDWENMAVAWRKDPSFDWNGPWKNPETDYGCFHRDSLRPHPDGDAIWAEYVASQLSD